MVKTDCGALSDCIAAVRPNVLAMETIWKSVLLSNHCSAAAQGGMTVHVGQPAEGRNRRNRSMRHVLAHGAAPTSPQSTHSNPKKRAMGWSDRARAQQTVARDRSKSVECCKADDSALQSSRANSFSDTPASWTAAEFVACALCATSAATLVTSLSPSRSLASSLLSSQLDEQRSWPLCMPGTSQA